MERLFITAVFFIDNKRNGKNFMAKYISVVPKYKNLFLYINFKLAPNLSEQFATNLPVHSFK